MTGRSGTRGIDFVEVPAGHLDEVGISQDEVRLSGWMLWPKEPLLRLEVLLDGHSLGDALAKSRPDVARVHRWISHAGNTGFTFHRAVQIQPGPSLREIEIRGAGRSGEMISMVALWDSGCSSGQPVPPESLIKLIGSPDASSYRSQGLKVFADITSAIRRYDDLDRFERVLDWGCGCGRLLTHLVSAFPEKTFSGCDLVPQAIEWCRERFPKGRFESVQPHPPTPFPEGSFDLVIASSVFTHLDRDLQERWLDELSRVLQPGGLVIASVLGEYAYLRDRCSGWRSWIPMWPSSSSARLRSRGILDQFRNNSLRDFVDSSYYRNTYQDVHYTIGKWSKHFRIRAYIERGLDNYQDLLVMQRIS